MKILNIRFKNLNALKGEWEVHFDRYPLSEAGIFAITGPNGAGKSTILDAIVLSLYGQTPRLQNPASQIMTLDENECLSEVTFFASGKKYRSRWGVKKSGNGNGSQLEEPWMKLVSVDGKETILEENPIRVRARIAELTGFDFQRFSRSIMLAQGEFAAFLNALDNERAEIIDKIVGPDLVLEYKNEVAKNVVDYQTAVMEISNQINELHILSLDELDEVKKQQEENTNKQITLTQKIDELEKEKRWLTEKDRLEAICTERKRILQETANLYEKINQDLDRVEKAKQIQEYRPDIEALDIKKQTHHTLKIEKETLKNELMALKTQLEQIEADQRQITTDLESAEKLMAQRRIPLENALVIDEKIRLQRREADILSKNAMSLNLEIEKLKAHQQDNKEKFEAKQKELEKLSRWLSANQIEGDISKDIPIIKEEVNRLGIIEKTRSQELIRQNEMKDMIAPLSKSLEKAKSRLDKQSLKQQKNQVEYDRAQENMKSLLGENNIDQIDLEFAEKEKKLSDLKNLDQISQGFQKAIQKEEKLQKSMAKAKVLLAKKKAEQKELQKQYDDVEHQYKESSQRLIKAKTIKNLQKLREQLEPKQACPLCGAHDHPFQLEEPLYNENQLAKETKQQKKKMNRLKQRLKGLEPAIARLENKTQQNIEALHQQKETLMAQWDDLNTQNIYGWQINGENFDKRVVSELQKEIKRDKKRINNIRQSQKKLNKIKIVYEKKSSRFDQIQLEFDRQQETIAQKNDEIQQIESRITVLNNQEKKSLSNLNDKLQFQGITFSATPTEFAWLDKIEQKQAEYQNQLQQSQQLKKDMSLLESINAKLPNQLETLTTEFDKTSESLDQAEKNLNKLIENIEKKYQTKDPVAERKNLENQVQEKLATKEILEKKCIDLNEIIVTTSQKYTDVSAKVEVYGNEIASLTQDLSTIFQAMGYADINQAQSKLISFNEQKAIESQFKQIVDQVENQRNDLIEAERNLDVHLKKSLLPEDLSESLSDNLADVTRAIQSFNNEMDALNTDVEDHNRIITEHHENILKKESLAQELEEKQSLFNHWKTVNDQIEDGEAHELNQQVKKKAFDRLLENSNAYLRQLNGRYTLKSTLDGYGIDIVDTIQKEAQRTPQSLSGGESFIVSMAMALGLSDLSSQNARIDSLFFDEGFGVLDDENLYTVLSIMENLRKTGKMVGIISHVKALQDRISTQIQVEKTADGMSRLNIVA